MVLDLPSPAYPLEVTKWREDFLPQTGLWLQLYLVADAIRRISGLQIEGVVLAIATQPHDEHIKGRKIVVPGAGSHAEWRTNFMGVGTDPNGTLFDLRVFDANGNVVLEVSDIPLGPWETELWSLGRQLGLSDLDGGFMEMSVTKGGAIFAASRVSNLTNDGQILEPWVLIGE